jgi:hypothetical protein
LSKSLADESKNIIKEDLNGHFINDLHLKKEFINDKLDILNARLKQKIVKLII